jgi:chromate transport protein ChrA
MPAFLAIWGILPFWKLTREREYVKKGLDGLALASVGFVLATAVKLYLTVISRDYIVPSILCAFAYYLLEYLKVSCPYVVLLCGFLDFSIS